VTLEDLLRRLVPLLERVPVPYMLTGSVASSAHGMPRSTRDLNIVIAPTRAQLQALMRERLFQPRQACVDDQLPELRLPMQTG
jgi:hypothetical protein